MITERSIVVLYLSEPREKFWGRLESLSQIGVHVRGLSLAMVTEWAREIIRGEEVSMGLSTIFFPLHRVEKILLDEDSGQAQSVRGEFLQIVGRDAEEFF